MTAIDFYELSKERYNKEPSEENEKDLYLAWELMAKDYWSEEE